MMARAQQRTHPSARRTWCRWWPAAGRLERTAASRSASRRWRSRRPPPARRTPPSPACGHTSYSHLPLRRLAGREAWRPECHPGDSMRDSSPQTVICTSGAVLLHGAHVLTCRRGQPRAGRLCGRGRPAGGRCGCSPRAGRGAAASAARRAAALPRRRAPCNAIVCMKRNGIHDNSAGLIV